MEGSSTGTSSRGIQTYTDSSGDTCWADDRLPLLATLPNGIAVTNSFCRARYVEYRNLLATGGLSERLAAAPVAGPEEETTYLELINRFISSFEAGDMATALRAERGARSIETAWAQGRSGTERPPTPSTTAVVETPIPSGQSSSPLTCLQRTGPGAVANRCDRSVYCRDAGGTAHEIMPASEAVRYLTRMENGFPVGTAPNGRAVWQGGAFTAWPNDLNGCSFSPVTSASQPAGAPPRRGLTFQEAMDRLGGGGGDSAGGSGSLQ